MTEPYRGVFPVVPTTFTDTGDLDLTSVEFHNKEHRIANGAQNPGISTLKKSHA